MANELALKYGCNPNQKPARIFMKEGELPIEVLNGRPGYINLLDAFNSWQLVQELKEATGLPAAAYNGAYLIHGTTGYGVFKTTPGSGNITIDSGATGNSIFYFEIIYSVQ